MATENTLSPTAEKSPTVDRANPPQNMSRKEAAIVACISLRKLQDLITKGKLRTIRVGDRRIVRLCDLNAFLNGCVA
jgi:excisionase family DNA binding protein